MRLLTCLGLAGLAAALNAPGAFAVTISELRIDQGGDDFDEYFELAGASGELLDGLTYLVIGDGSTGSGTLECVIDLTGYAINAEGFFVVAEETYTLSTPDLTVLSNALNFENSDNVTHLLVSNFTGMSGDDLDVDDDGVLDVTPWDSVVDAIGLVETVGSGDHYYGAALGFEDIGPDGNYVPAQVYRCVPTGGWTIGEFTLGETDTPGEANAICPGIAALAINELRIDQGGDDFDEYFELIGLPGEPLDGVTYVVIGDGSTGSGTVECVVDLTSLWINAEGFFVAAEDTYTLGTPDLMVTPNILNFENSDNVTHLLAYNFTGALDDDLDVDDDGVLDVTPWDLVIDAIGLVETVGSGDHYYGAALGFEDIGPDGPYVPAQVYRCTPEAEWTIGAFSLGETDTPGEINLPCTVPCPADINGDGVVAVEDLLALLAAWGNTGGPEDVNGDGIVDVQDLLDLLSAWGPCL